MLPRGGGGERGCPRIPPRPRAARSPLMGFGEAAAASRIFVYMLCTPDKRQVTRNARPLPGCQTISLYSQIVGSIDIHEFDKAVQIVVRTRMATHVYLAERISTACILSWSPSDQYYCNDSAGPSAATQIVTIITTGMSLALELRACHHLCAEVAPLRPISLLRLSLPRLLDSNYP